VKFQWHFNEILNERARIQLEEERKIAEELRRKREEEEEMRR
jgi:hypothetical protein